MRMSLPTVYLSARFSRREELNRYREELAEAGIEVTSRWLTDPTAELTGEAWRILAVKDPDDKDRDDIRRADALVLFADSGRDSRGGRHVEFGMALALEKRLIVVGEIENLFQCLTEVEVVNSWAGAVALLTHTPEQVASECG